MNCTIVLEYVNKIKLLCQNSNASDLLDDLEKKCIEEIREQEARKSGYVLRYKALERVMKSCLKDTRPALQGCWFDEIGMQCLCDGFQAYRLNKHYDLMRISDDVNPIDLTRIFPGNLGEVLQLPSRTDLVVHIKAEKARKKSIKDKSCVTYDFGEDLPLVNAEYLLNVLEIFPDCTAYFYAVNRGIYFLSEDGEALVLPIKRKDK